MELLDLLADAMNIYSFAGLLAYVCIWLVVQRVWLRPRRLERWLRAQGLKGNPYRLWYGDMKDLARMTAAVQSKPIGVHDDVAPYALPFHHHIITKYGKRSFIWLGPTPRIMIMEPDMIKDVLQNSEVFGKITIHPLNRLVITGLVVYEGEKWVKHRRLLNPSFAIAKLKDMVSTMHISCKELVERLGTMPSNTMSHEVDVYPILSNFAADIISRTAFGSSYKEGHKIFLLQKEQAQLAMQLNRTVYIPGSRFLPTKINKRLKEMDREMKDCLKGVIENKVEGLKSEKKINNKNDLLSILLESNSKELVEEKGHIKEMGITIDDVISECKLFYLAGQETTANLLVWTMVLLSIHQNWQMEAREEVFEVFGNTIPDFDGLQQLKKINMILHEVLRLYTITPLMFRTTKEDTKLGDLILPGGVEVLIPGQLIHHDKETWGDDAKEFKPERFAQGVMKATKGQRASFFPFGLGPRICIGMNFAMVEAKLALTMILRSFTFKLSPNYEHAPTPILTLQPKFGAKILLSKI